MAKGERIGKVSVGVSPEFDQAELFRQVKAASAKVPALKLPVQITAASVNKAVREVNQKKLAALKLPVSISVADVNKAVRAVNQKKLAAIKPPVQLTVLEVNKAIKEVNRKRLLPIKTSIKIDDRDIKRTSRELLVFDKRTNQATRGLGKFAANITVLRTAFGLVRIAAMATAIGFLAQAFASATVAATALAAAAGTGLAGGLAAGANSMGALVQASKVLQFSLEGVKQALGDLNEQADPDKLAALTPAARSFVLQLEALKPAARGAQQAIQQELFGGVSQALKTATPLLRDFIPPLAMTARILGELSIGAVDLAATLKGDLNRILVTNNVLLRIMGQTALNLAGSLVNVLTVAGPLSVAMARLGQGLSASLLRIIETSRESGKLAHFFELAYDNLVLLGRLLGSVGGSLINVFRAALPFGTQLLLTLNGVFQQIDEFTGSKKGQQALTEFFRNALPLAEEFGRLIRDLGKSFIQLAEQPGFLAILTELRTKLLPVLTDVIGKLTAEFGPTLVHTLTQVLTLFATLASESGPLNLLVEWIGKFASGLDWLLTHIPGLKQFLAVLFVMETALAVVAIQSTIFAASGLSSAIAAVIAQSAGLTAVAGGLRAVGLAALAAIAPFLAFAAAVGAVAIGFMVAYNNSETFRNGVDAFSGAVLDNSISKFFMLRESLEALSDSFLRLQGIVDTGEFDTSGPLIARLKKIQKEKQKAAGIDSDTAKAGKDINKTLAEQMELYGGLGSVALPQANEMKAAQEAQAAATKQMNQALQRQRDQLSLYGEAVDRQKTKVDALRTAIDELKNIQLEGTKAFSDARFALDQETKALELQQVQLKLGGATDTDPRLKALQEQLDVLGLKAQEVDLTESLQLDPLRKQWDETINPIKELSFDKAIESFHKLSMQHTVQSKKLAKMEAGYKAMEKAINAAERAAHALSATFSEQLATMPATAIDGGAAAGQALLAGLQTGARSQLKDGSDLHKLLNQEIPDFIRENKGPVSYDATILVPAGEAIMTGLTKGLRSGFEPVKGFLKEVGPSMEEYVPANMFGKRTAEFMVEVARGNKPDPKKFFGDLTPDPITMTGGVVDPSLGFLHRTMSLADTTAMANSLAKTYGLHVSSIFRPGAITSSGNRSDHGYGYAADFAGSISAMDRLAAALRPMFGHVIKQLIWRNKDQNRGFYVPDHMDHVHAAFLPASGFSLMSGKVGMSAAKTPYAHLFQLASQKFGVPVKILQAVAKAESGFNALAGSPAGAKGLMQLMPATFASLGVGGNIFDPKQNIFAGAKYLAQQMKKFKSLKLALAAYNAGPGNAGLALTSFAETIKYVARVLKFLEGFGGFRAMGGPTAAGKSYVVGEKGPELWMERRPGHIINNKDLMEISSLLREIRDTGGLRQQTLNVQTASQDPRVVAELIEIRNKRKLARVRG